MKGHYHHILKSYTYIQDMFFTKYSSSKCPHGAAVKHYYKMAELVGFQTNC